MISKRLMRPLARSTACAVCGNEPFNRNHFVTDGNLLFMRRSVLQCDGSFNACARRWWIAKRLHAH